MSDLHRGVSSLLREMGVRARFYLRAKKLATRICPSGFLCFTYILPAPFERQIEHEIEKQTPDGHFSLDILLTDRNGVCARALLRGCLPAATFFHLTAAISIGLFSCLQSHSDEFARPPY